MTIPQTKEPGAPLMFGVADVHIAFVVGLVLIALVSKAYLALTAWPPMFGLPLMLATAGAYIHTVFRIRRGQTDAGGLGVLSASSLQWIITAALAAFVMPMLFPAHGYENGSLLRGINALVLGTALLAIPAFKLNASLVRYSARLRQRR